VLYQKADLDLGVQSVDKPVDIGKTLTTDRPIRLFDSSFKRQERLFLHYDCTGLSPSHVPSSQTARARLSSAYAYSADPEEYPLVNIEEQISAS
jgi:hypothetical protein